MEIAKITELVREKFPQHFVERERPEVKEAEAPERPKPLVRSAQVLREEIEIKPEGVGEVLQFLKNDSRLDFDLLHCITGTDYDPSQPLGVTWMLTSIRHKHWVGINTRVDRERPHVPSVFDLWPAADWLERETFDLVGIHFDGHPNLKRILCADDWEGHPLRKDYVFPQSYHGIPTAKEVRWNS